MERRYRAIIQLGESVPEKHERALRNARTLLEELGSDTEVELLFHNQAVELLTVGRLDRAEEMRQLHERGVCIAACGRALEGLGLTRDALLDFVHVVPTSTTELVKRQAEGWAYIKM